MEGGEAGLDEGQAAGVRAGEEVWVLGREELEDVSWRRGEYVGEDGAGVGGGDVRGEEKDSVGRERVRGGEQSEERARDGIGSWRSGVGSGREKRKGR